MPWHSGHGPARTAGACPKERRGWSDSRAWTFTRATDQRPPPLALISLLEPNCRGRDELLANHVRQIQLHLLAEHDAKANRCSLIVIARQEVVRGRFGLVDVGDIDRRQRRAR